MKNNFLAVILILFGSMLLCFAFARPGEKVDTLKDEYTNLNKDHMIKEINATTLVNKIENDESFIIMLGFPACPWCQALMPVLDECCKNDNYRNIYYCDLKDMRDNPESIDKANYEYLYNFSTIALDTAKDRINAPTLLAIKDGEIVGFNLDTVPGHVLSESGILPELNDTQKVELVNIIKDLINKTK